MIETKTEKSARPNNNKYIIHNKLTIMTLDACLFFADKDAIKKKTQVLFKFFRLVFSSSSSMS